jgi:ABC-type dipeptide/oligopeptide/nickel transport system ATPase component
MKIIESFDLHSINLTAQGYQPYLTNLKYKKQMKVACSGSSGSGKTTLVTYIAEQTGLKHISGSAGDIKQEGDKMMLDEMFRYPGGGHAGVIRYSALNPEYGVTNQKLLQLRRGEMIRTNDNFITDRSPADNLTYFVNQVGYHPMVTDAMTEQFANDCLSAWNELTHVVFVKAVQPEEVERNGSRIANRFYQKAVDAQFEYWIREFFMKKSVGGPEVLIIDFWDLERRKQTVMDFLNA